MTCEIQAGDEGQWWHRILAIVMKKHGIEQVVLTPADFMSVDPGSAVVSYVEGDGMHIRIIDRETAERM